MSFGAFVDGSEHRLRSGRGRLADEVRHGLGSRHIDGVDGPPFATQIAISEETVKAHMKSIFGKLDMTDRTHAVTVAARRGVITL